MTNSADTNRYKGLALDALRATGAKLRKNFVDVFIEVMFLYVSMRKVNFTQMGKYGKHCEQTYRNNFTKDVDWVAYNTHLAREVFSDPSDLLAIAVDQSHITKSGKCTWGVGRFWSGCDQSVMPGLEVTGFGAVNATRRECMALRAVQTPGKDWFKEHSCDDGREMDQHDWYIKVIGEYARQLQAITNILVADALYSTEKIVTAMVLLGFVMVSRLRKDTVLRYVYTGPRTGKRGAPRKYDGKIDPVNPDLGRMERVDALCGEEEGEYYTLVANVKCLKRNVRLVIWYPKGVAGVNEKGGGYKLFFSTDTEMPAEKCVAVYKARFQLEFVFRDGNQFTGLEDCQARSKEKLDFAFNASLAAINTAKAAIKEMGADLSVGEYTALMHSTLIYQRIMCVSGIKPDPAINRRVMNELFMLAKNAA
jgi:hypothetical protein